MDFKGQSRLTYGSGTQCETSQVLLFIGGEVVAGQLAQLKPTTDRELQLVGSLLRDVSGGGAIRIQVELCFFTNVS